MEACPKIYLDPIQDKIKGLIQALGGTGSATGVGVFGGGGMGAAKTFEPDPPAFLGVERVFDPVPFSTTAVDEGTTRWGANGDQLVISAYKVAKGWMVISTCRRARCGTTGQGASQPKDASRQQILKHPHQDLGDPFWVNAAAVIGGVPRQLALGR